MKSLKASFPVVEIGAAKGRGTGSLLELPDDFAPAKPETLETAKRSQRTLELLAEEDAHLKSIGLTWEELQEYQRKLLE